MTPRRLVGLAGRLARGLGGLATLMVLLAGVPWGLWHWVGWPLPHALPTWTELGGALTSNGVPDQVVINTLAIVVWAAWAGLVVSVVAETVAVVRGRTARRVPLAGPLQPLAASLVATVLLLLPQASMRPLPLPQPVAVVRTVGHLGIPGQPPAPGEHPQRLLSEQPRPLAAHPATTSTPARPPQPARLRYTVHGPDPARGIKRDTLWGIAERLLGDGRRYGEIYQLNQDREQPDGGRLTDPDRILPGWVLDLPADAHDPLATTSQPPPQHHPQPSPPPSPPASSRPGPAQPPQAGAPQRPAPPTTTTRPSATTHAERQPPAAPTDTTARRHRPAIGLPGGSVVGPSLAAAIAAALALALLHRRRRWRPSPPGPGLRHTDPLITPAVGRLLRAASGADQADDDTDDGHDAVAGVPSPSPAGVPALPIFTGTVAVAQQGDAEATADLTAGGFGLVGPSAPAAARAIITTLLGHARPDTAQVLIGGNALAGQLLGDPLPLPGLTVTDDLGAALDSVEVELLRRTRLLADHGIADVGAYATFDPAEPLEPLILVADGRSEAFTPRLHAVLVAGRRLGIGAVLLGANPAGPTAVADPAGTIVEPSDTSADLLGARLYTLTVDEAHQLLRVIAAGRGAEPALPQPAPPPAEEPAPAGMPAPDGTSPPAESPPARPVEVGLLGPLQVRLHGRQLTKGLRSKAPELLAYLLVHPAGVTRDAAIEALWPELDPDRGVAWFKAVLGNLRRALGPAAAANTAVIARVGDRYQANPDLIGCDLWRFQRALATAGAATDPAAKSAALKQALAAYHGDLMDGADYDWALTEREDLRRQAISAARRLADLHQQTGDHERALDALEQAVRWDPYSEELYQQIMGVQARLGRPGEIRATYRRLELRMADLDDDPSQPTRQLRDQLLRAARSPGGHPTSK